MWWVSEPALQGYPCRPQHIQESVAVFSIWVRDTGWRWRRAWHKEVGVFDGLIKLERIQHDSLLGPSLEGSIDIITNFY